MCCIFDKIKSIFTSESLSANERWEKYSSTCKRDLTIKKTAQDALKCLSVSGGIVSFSIPFLAIALQTGGLSLVIGTAIIAVCGIAAAILGVRKADDLNDYFDWTDYSDKILVNKDIERISNLSLDVLADIPKSCVYRIENLEKYGVLSSENAEKMQDIVKRFLEVRSNIKKYCYDNPVVSSEEATTKYQKEHELLNKQKMEVENEWKQFQLSVKNDLPSIS